MNAPRHQKDRAAALRRQARVEADARRGKLGRGRYDKLVQEIAAAIRLAFEAGATATLFGLEGPLREAIRSDLCLQGWRWTDADAMAREMLGDAFRAIRATRPTWEEGQREWTVHAGTLIERTHCARCHKPLPEGHFKFCSHLCAASLSGHVARMKMMDEDRAVRSATRWI